MYVLQVDFPFNGPFGEQMSAAMQDLAADIAQETDLLWKIWTENEQQQEAGGIYLFNTQQGAQVYLEKHSQRLQAAGVTNIRSRIFAVNRPLSLLDKAPI